MVELRLYSKPVETVFDLLGRKEDDATYSVGWGLAQSDAFAQALLARAYGKRKVPPPTAIRLQEIIPGQGRTDIEIETEDLHMVVEAKHGWTLPTKAQLELYVARLKKTEPKQALLLAIAESSADWVGTRDFPKSVDGVPVKYLSWETVAGLASTTADHVKSPHEKRLLRDLTRYLKGLMNMQDATSNLVYVVSLGVEPLYEGGPSFADFITKDNICFQPVGGGRGGWPSTPPNYLAFRFHGRLQQIRHVESWEIQDEPWEEKYPGLSKAQSWEPSPHFLYKLGPVIEPKHEVPTGGQIRNQRFWCALDLLLTSRTVVEARDLTRKRLEAAGVW